MMTLNEAKNYLRVDGTEDDAFISVLINVADGYLKASVGSSYDNTDERAKTLSLIIIADLYDNRGISEASTNVRKLVDDFSLQLRLELRT